MLTSRTKRLGFALWTVLAVGTLCLLGNWQLDRLSWKKQLISEIIKGHQAEPVPLQKNMKEWRRVFVSGQWLSLAPIMVGPVALRGRAGWHVISPLRLKSGRVILINRGWVNLQGKVSIPKGRVQTLEGIIRRQGDFGVFTPSNNPQKNQWPNLIPREIAAEYKITDLEEFWVEATKVGDDSNIVPVGILSLPPNNHFQYAVTWFAFAATAFVIGGLFLFRNR